MSRAGKISSKYLLCWKKNWEMELTIMIVLGKISGIFRPKQERILNQICSFLLCCPGCLPEKHRASFD